MKNRKTSYRAYTAWNYDQEEKDLDQQSQNGWQLVKGGCFHSKFEKDDSVVYRNRIDFNPVILKDRQEKERYISFFEEQGWEFVSSTYNGWVYFKKRVQVGIPEEEYRIYSDHESLYQMMNRWLWLGRALDALTVIAAVVYLINFVENQEFVYIYGAVIYLGLTLWISNGMRKLKKKLEKQTIG